MTETQTTKGHFIQHTSKENDKKVLVHSYLFIVDTGVAEITIASPKYWKFLGENENWLTPTPELLEAKLLENEKSGGTDLYILKDGFSLTESMFLRGETQLALGANGQPNTFGAQGVTIKSVEVDDNAIVITLSDGATAKRNFTRQIKLPQPDGTVKEEYFADIAKKARFFQNELGQNVTPVTVSTFDVSTLVGGFVDYRVEESSFGQKPGQPAKYWLKFSNFTKQPAAPQMTPEELNALLAGGQA